MSTAKKIYEHLLKLPESAQAEVLDFVSYLEAKETKSLPESSLQLEISLAMAMRGMEEETTPEYSMADLKEVF